MDQNTMRAWAEIHTDAFAHNFETARRHTHAKIMCVIKGNAHGHGAAVCGKVLEEQGADAFGVACLTEGIALRESGIQRPILILGWTPAQAAEQLADHGLAQSVPDEEYALELSAAAAACGKTVDIHVKVDTGMSRTGFLAQQEHGPTAAAIMRIAALPNLCIKGIFTHFAAADMEEKDDFTAWQLTNFRRVLAELSKLGFDRDIVRHAANSAGLLYHPDTHFDMVRIGVMIYGLYPTGARDPENPLDPALALKARVAQVKELPAGAHISYGCTAQTTKPTTIAVVTAGYADAYPRSLSNRGAYAVIRGQKCPQIGRICMDMCMFDVTGKDVHRGDEVILYGRGGMPMEEVAALAGTINCEPLCVLTDRVQKVYL